MKLIQELLALSAAKLLTEDKASKIKKILDTRSSKLLLAFKQDGSELGHDATADDVIKKLSDADPSPEGDAVNWLVNMYCLKLFKLEDVPRLHKDIETFYKYKTALTNKDLNSYKSLTELYAALEPYQDSAVGRAGKTFKETSDQVTYLIKTPDFKALIPKTQEAACFYGEDTKWCTAADDEHNRFDMYNSKGELIIIILNYNGKVRKYQMHYETNSFMDKDDSPITKQDIDILSSFPEYKKLLNSLIKKHYHG